VDVITAEFTDAEAGALVEAERVIERGLKTFVEVGQALARIRDGQLYRTEYATFEAYCDERWAISRPRAYELMSAAQVVSAMADTGYRSPANERQARELARAPEEERAEVWREANERAGGRPTAATVREVVRERQAPPPPPPTDVDADVIMLRYSKVAGWIVGTPGAAPFATAGVDIPELDVKAAQLWAGDETWTVHEREVIRWAESTDRAGAWVAVLADDAPAAKPEPPAPTPPPPVERPMPARQDVADRIVAGIDQHAAAPVVEKPPAWDPAEREAHMADVQKRRAIEDAHQQAKTLVPDIRSRIHTVLAGYRLGEKHLVTRDQIADLRAALDLLEKEIDGEA
jgi:hypothetical protein